MKKIILVFILMFYASQSVFAETGNRVFSWWIVIPKEMNFTERFIITELKDLRVDLESQKREIYNDIQQRDIGIIDKALSYNANTVNFFFIFMTVIIAWIWMLGWKTLSDIKRATKESMEKETWKIINDFQNKIKELEKEQKVNILWRQFNILDNEKEKLEVLNSISKLNPNSNYERIERSNIYLSMSLFSEVINITTKVLSNGSSKHKWQAYFNRACAYNQLWEEEKSISDLKILLQTYSGYSQFVLDSECLSNLVEKSELKAFLK